MPKIQHAADAVSVVFAANDYYTPYLSTLVASILHNYASKHPLELYVLARDFTDAHKARLVRQAEDGGATLTFIDVAAAMEPYEEHLHIWAHFKIETYFRLLLPQLLPDHDKVVYLDADMVCLADVGELFDTDVEGYLLAACKDPDTTGIYNGVDVELGQPDKRAYMDEVLKIKEPYDYFQAGTLVFNLDEWRRSIDVGEVFSFAQQRTWQLLDQDVLNYFCQGHVRFLDMSWNVMFDNGGFRITDIISRTTPELRHAYDEARANPRIIHYAGPFKPWSDPGCDFADVFWYYGRMTPFYELMLMREFEQRMEGFERHLAGTDALLDTVNKELTRFEQRSAALMLKEFVYKKVLIPTVDRLFADSPVRSRIRDLYRKVHPTRQQGMESEDDAR